MATSQLTRRRGENNDTAVASFLLGLLGLFIFNIVLGPLSIVLALVSLARGTERRGRALTGLALGVADLVVLAVLITVHPGGSVLHLGI
jgi:hypothetical protein